MTQKFIIRYCLQYRRKIIQIHTVNANHMR